MARVSRGRSYPSGARLFPGGCNFSVYSKHATSVELLLFDAPGDLEPARVVRLDPALNKTYHYWHAAVSNVRSGQLYAWRADGPLAPERGLRFDGDKALLDPYARGVVIPEGYDRAAACRPGPCLAPRGVVVDSRAYDWEGDQPLRHPFSKTVIYEAHLAGFTKHPGSGAAPSKRGTYAGFAEKIPYLRDLGVTAVELLPIFAFDPADAPSGLTNYWGYAPISFFAPHPAYSSRKDPLGPLDEFRDLVKALHRAGIEVILDVVFNHTAEGDGRGPTLSFKGLANDAYYLLEADRARYANYSGTGNTLNANHTVTRRLVLDSLRHWVEVMHVDGFRFDLASILSRDEKGRPLENPPLIWDIESDPVLASAKMIAEAWDAGGLYQVGRFAGDSWKEWNGKFRDDVRSFMKGDPGAAAMLPARMLGSPDLYGHEEREPERSVNFVTCHDGFTLNDLVTYDRKRNEANLEENRDGSDDNHSWNGGVEGPSDDPALERLRERQIRNLLTLTLFSIGTPMILMGDEARRTQKGNNNAYCQDNEISWFDWSLVEKHPGLGRFVRMLIRQRQEGLLPRPDGASLNAILRGTAFAWHGTELGKPDWSPESRIVAFTAAAPGRGLRIHAMMNAHWDAKTFELPPGAWRRWVDTALPSPQDIREWDDAPAVPAGPYRAESRSIVMLVGPSAS